MATEDKIKLVLKGILLYTTVIISILFIMGIDTIYEEGYFFLDIAICAGLIYTCYKTIDESELDILTFYKYTNEKVRKDDEW